ncbi:MAG: hypothetical protein HXY25_01030 [Alphaproteobacteria bacterium]|nr:hypothetical protein [Alphaproteobacteria bacterium]
MTSHRRTRTGRAAALAMIGLLPLVLAATSVPGEGADTDSTGAGGPFLPNTIARTADHLKPKLTLAVTHRSYEMRAAGPILYPEGALDFSFRAEDPGLGAAAGPRGVSYAVPTGAIKPRAESSWTYAYLAPSILGEAGHFEELVLDRRSEKVELVFERGGSLIGEGELALLDQVAERVLKSGTQLEIFAYAGDVNDRTSTAKRLALRRGLAVRTYLVDQGVPKTRMSVNPIGGVSDTGPLDRVDILLSAS